ncbi:bifunctional enoyl-CoA hydratase/phosphate acetyltransferase [Luteimonas sp. MC1782]|nr:bifunctional enoyl-CoA hydratase/phosphate acetyltransferase [Luteimonas sp. MC1895]MBJ6978473.1 bifunctional enoyl-CoA hydratase/phosphate acetyltransferase [Luteimonas sp. MC1895]
MPPAPASPVTEGAQARPVRRTDANGNDGLARLLEHVAGLAPVRAAMVHPCDALSLAAALDVRDAGLVEPVLVAPRARLEAAAADAGLDISGLAVEDVAHSHAAAMRAAELARNGEVEILIKGSLHTDELMSAVVASVSGLRTKRRVSHCFVIQTPHYPRPFLVTDAAVNLAPDLMQKADIVQNAIDLARVLGIDKPRVAILAAVETVNPSMQATLDAAALCKMADRGQITGGVLDGPLAFDNAVSMEAAQAKGIASPVAGRADILVVPDLESGNMLAKQLIFMGQAASAGIVLGARVPVVLTSRADPRESRMASCAIALMLAHHYRKSPP